MAMQAETAPRRPAHWARFALRNLPITIGAVILVTILLIVLIGPMVYTVDPNAVSPLKRLKPPSAEYPFGTDALGRTCSPGPSTAAGCR